MKRFLGKVGFFVVLAILFSVILPCVLVDPYNVFHWRAIRNNGIEPNQNYIKTAYILEHPDKFDGFIFGSSRVGAIHGEKIEGHRIYNMSYSMGTPRENLATLQTFLEGGVKPQIIFLGVDNFSYMEDPAEHEQRQLQCPYQILKKNPVRFAKLYCNPVLVGQGVEYLFEGKETNGFDAFYEYGWWCDYGKTTDFDWSKAEPSIGNANRMDEALQDIQAICDICKENNIQLVVFTNPLCALTYQTCVEWGYLTFLEKLSAITEYYNFGGYNEIMWNKENYLDASHYNAEVGDMLIDVMCNGARYQGLYERGFGRLVTVENVVEVMDLLKRTY